MSLHAQDAASDEAVRDEAAAWLATLRGGSGDRHHAAFEQWYAADPRHAEIYDALLDSWDKMAIAGRTPIAQLSPGLADASRPARRRMAYAAAALLLAAVGGLGLYRFAPHSDGPRPELASQIGEIRTVMLPDGSRVILDTSSAITWHYADDQRAIRLERGRARFDVAHATNRPFVVTAGSGVVIAHGTLFDVDMRETTMTVSLLRGSVEVRIASGSAGSRATVRMLRPGQRLAVAQDQALGASVPVRDQDIRWPTGMLAFQGAPLGEVVAAVNRYNTTHIVLARSAPANAQFTGTLTARDPATVAQLLAASFALVPARDQQGNIELTPRTEGAK